MAKTNKKSKAKSKAGKPAAKGGITGFQIGLIIAALVIVAGGAVVGVLLSTSGGSGDSAGGIKLPDFVYKSTAPKGTPIAYQFALDNPDDMKQIPCYCGCGELDGHTSNLDCFIKSRDGDKVEFDQHAVG